MARKKAADSTSAPVTDDAPPSADGYTVVARRYRPQLFGELVGQDPVAQALGNAIGTNRVAHAYLFTGARGVGKTTTARILDKWLNSEKGATPTSRNESELSKGFCAGRDGHR